MGTGLRTPSTSATCRVEDSRRHVPNPVPVGADVGDIDERTLAVLGSVLERLRRGGDGMIAINRHERDRLRHELTNCMGGIDDLFDSRGTGATGTVD